MSNYRKSVRLALYNAIAHASTGFNPRLAALAAGADYDFVPFTIDWAADSRSFLMSAAGPDNFEVSDLIDFPGAVLYGGPAVDDRAMKGKEFSGSVVLGLDIYLRYRALRDAQTASNDITQTAARWNTEEVADAVEDAVCAVARSIHSDNFILAGYTCDRDSAEPLDDGYSQRLKFSFSIRTHV